MTSAPKFNPNDDVRRVGSPRSKGIVRGGPYDRGSGPQYDVEWVLPQHGRGFVPEPDLEPFLAAAGPGWTGRGEFLSHLGLVKLVDPFTNVLLSMGWSRTEFHPCQFIPALQFVQHARHGLLIADEVGLGKTIEAALVLRELTARARTDRVLVVCPANLRSKWQDELSRRFDLKFDLLRGAQPEEILKRMQRDNVEPALHAIVSFESIRRGEDGPHPAGGGVRRAIEESGITFDLVIFDEAHHMRNAPTKTSRAGRALSEQADHVLLLSATPLQTDRDDLLTLLRLLEPSVFRDMNADDLDEFLEPNRGINAALEALSRLPADPARAAAGMREAAGQRVLLSTEVAAEGVDLQFCDAIINYDLPRNPMRVEQRIGRIDRFGQKAGTVAVASFKVSETIDSRILDRLYERINVFEESIGELEPIFRQAIPELQAGIFAPGLTRAEQEQLANDRILQIEQERDHREHLAAEAAELMGHGPLLAAEIETAERSGRYVSAPEAEAVVDWWLSDLGSRDSRLEHRRGGARRLKLAPTAVEAARRAMTEERIEDSGSGLLLARLANGDSVDVTFDRAVAADRRTLPFIHIGHPIVRAPPRNPRRRLDRPNVRLPHPAG